jgi:glycosyltransferase involved in cell wall biosynthesis
VTSVAVLTPTVPSRNWLLKEAVASVEAQTIQVRHLIGDDIDREGPARVRNRLADSSDAAWLLPLDDDDLLDTDCVELLLAASANADIIYPWCRVEDHAEGLEPWSPNRLYRPEPLLNYNFIPVTALIRHELWDAVDGMPIVPHAEDFRMWRQMIAAGARVVCVPEQLWTYRRGIAGSRNQWTETNAA